MARGLECVEALIATHGVLRSEALTRCLEKLWEFTSSDRFDDWEDSAIPIVGGTRWDPNVGALLELLFHIGRCNLYGAIVDYGICTAAALIAVECACKSLGLQLLADRPVNDFGFDVDDGWGRAFSRGEWMADR
jgi:hypothetical protein